MNWRTHAICKGQTELFFSQQPAEQLQARRLCEECPVTGACAQEAFNVARQHQLYGMWGGTTKSYRERLVGHNTHLWGT
jgi:hypothetical protein